MPSVVLGGTFHSLHAGHRSLLLAAKPFGKITIGLTSDAFAKRMKIYPCAKYGERLASLRRFLSASGMLSKATIVPINDSVGPSVKEKSISAIIVSSETLPMAKKINSIRKRRNLRPLRIISIPMLHAMDGIRISCTRVEGGKISPDGKRKTPLVLSAGTKNPTKLQGIKSACARAFPKIRCKFLTFKITNHAPEQPIGFAQTWKGAKTRAEIAYRRGRKKSGGAKNGGAGAHGGNAFDYGVGLESGLIKFGKNYFDIQFCCLYDGFEYSAGCSMGFPVPGKIIKEINNGKKSMGTIVSNISGIKNIGAKGGALAFLSGGLLHRKEMVEQAFLCALVQRRAKI